MEREIDGDSIVIKKTQVLETKGKWQMGLAKIWIGGVRNEGWKKRLGRSDQSS